MLHAGMKIAQIYFEELKEIPERTYNEQENASFRNKKEYRGFGKYAIEYNNHIKSCKKIKEDIESTSDRIYGNVLRGTNGNYCSHFSMLSISYQAFVNADLSPNYIIAMNLSLTFCIVVMLGMIFFLVNKQKLHRTIIFTGISHNASHILSRYSISSPLAVQADLQELSPFSYNAI